MSSRIDVHWIGLTAAELPVAYGLLNGLSNVEIAEKNFISEKTVKFHLTRIYKKGETKSRTHFVAKFENKKEIYENRQKAYSLPEQSRSGRPVGG